MYYDHHCIRVSNKFEPWLSILSTHILVLSLSKGKNISDYTKCNFHSVNKVLVLFSF